MARPGDVVRALGRGPALGRAAAGAGATIGQALMAHGARRREEEQLERAEGIAGAKAAGYALVPETIAQSLKLDLSGHESVEIPGSKRRYYAVPVPTTEGGIRVGGRTFPNTPEGQAAAIEWQTKVSSAGRAPEKDVIRAGGRDFPNTQEGQAAALDWETRLSTAGRKPDVGDEEGGELGPGTTNWTALRAEIKSSAAGKVAEEVGRLGGARGLSSNTEAVQRIWEKLRADYGNVEGRALQAIWREAIREAEQEATKTKTSGAAADLIERYRPPQPQP